MAMELKQIIKQNPVMAIMRNVPWEDTLPYGEAVLKGGVRVFEVALNSASGLEQIRLLKKELGSEAVIGAGTAVTVELVKKAVDAGADFLLTPNTDERILEYCAGEKLSLMPGVMTPSEVGLCLRYGYHLLKLFPAGELPLSYVKTIKGPFDNTDYLAIGGVRYGNWREFIQHGFLGVGLGSSLFPKELVKSRDWDAMRKFVEEQYSANPPT